MILKKEIDMSKIIPKKVKGWVFFNNNVEVCDEVSPLGISGLEPQAKKVAKMFISSLKGCKRVLDIGCGTGYPGLYVADKVKEIVFLDAAYNMAYWAKEYSSGMDIENTHTLVGGDVGLPFKEDTFDGVMMSGLLESMDWDSVHKTMSETFRVLKRGGIFTVLNQDFEDYNEGHYENTSFVRFQNDKMHYQLVEFEINPLTEKDTHYVIKDDSNLYKKLKNELRNNTFCYAKIDTGDLTQENVEEAWYDESAKFSVKSTEELVRSHKLTITETKSDSSIWDSIIFLTARKGD
jgi:ubiquinone/menaquinone biosynthesis C-methylase UbiE